MAEGVDPLHPYGPGSHAPLADPTEMPRCHPIKGNVDSGKYHRPDSSGYAATRAEVWFVSPSVAQAAGFELAGSHPEGAVSSAFEPGGARHPCTAREVAELIAPAFPFPESATSAEAPRAPATIFFTSPSGPSDEGEPTDVVFTASDAGGRDVGGEGAPADVVFTASDADGRDVGGEDEAVGEAPVFDVPASDAGGRDAGGEGAPADVVFTASGADGRDVGGEDEVVGEGAVFDVPAPDAEAIFADWDEQLGLDDAGVESVPPRPAARDEADSVDDPHPVVGPDPEPTTGPEIAGAIATQLFSIDPALQGEDGPDGGDGAGRPAADLGHERPKRSRWLAALLASILVVAVVALFLSSSRGGDDDVATDAANTAPTAVGEPASSPASVPAAPTAPDPAPGGAPAEPAPTSESAAPSASTPQPDDVSSTCPSLVRTLEAGGFGTVVLGLVETGLLDASTEGPLTVFAPDDAAFDALPVGLSTAVLGDRQLFAEFLRYHLATVAAPGARLQPTALATLASDTLAVRNDLGGLTVNNARIVQPDLQGGDCVAHGIDAVLVPPNFLRAVGIDSLNAAVGSGPIGFVDDTNEPTPTGAQTLAAICAYASGIERFEGIPAVRWQASGVASGDDARNAAVTAAMQACGAEGVALEPVPAGSSVDG